MKRDVLKRIVEIMDNAETEDDKITLQIKDLVLENRKWNSSEKISGSFSELFSEYIKMPNNHSIETTVKSGFENFDKMFGGFSSGEFVVVGGRPSMGKTQVLVSICKTLSESTPVDAVSGVIT